jgi:hypothetical protein
MPSILHPPNFYDQRDGEGEKGDGLVKRQSRAWTTGTGPQCDFGF